MGHDGTVLDLGSWFILRMAGGDTLRVVEYLTRRGFEAWTPIERKRGRMPRTRASFDKAFALMPTYAFASVHDLNRIHHLASVPANDRPCFSVFQHNGGVPLIGDGQLDALRAEEGRLQGIYERACRKGRRGPRFDPGQAVRLTEGPFAGLDGVVQEQQGQFALVNLRGFHSPIKIQSLLLLDESVKGEMEIAA